MNTFDSQQFLTWVRENNLLVIRLSEIARRLEGFLIENVLNDERRAKCVASKLEDVLKNCDEITYDEDGAAEAYAILHFLDRYHRFQLIFLKMIESDLLTINREEIDNLDVGTGPAPALFALSDIYSLVREYHTSNNIRLPFKLINEKNDYVERSKGFRYWLHHFTEYANYIDRDTNDIFYNVPYHHGKFDDFKGIEFNRNKSLYDFDDDGDPILVRWTEKTRNNLVIFSNFLTNNETVDTFAEELYNSALYLRNKGVLLVVGARRNSDKYKHVYTRLDEIIDEGRFSNHRFIGSCKRVELTEDEQLMSYSYNSPEGNIIKTFLSNVLEKFKEINAIDLIAPSVLEMLNKTIQDKYNYQVKWEMHLYQKFSKPRRKMLLKRKRTIT